METVKELLSKLVNPQGGYKVGDLIKLVGVVTGQDTSVKSIQFKVEDEDLGSLEISIKAAGSTVGGFSFLFEEGKIGTKVGVEGQLIAGVRDKDGQPKVNIEATKVVVLELPVIERPVGLPLSGRGTLLKLVAGDVIRTPEDTLKTLSTLEAKIINESINNGTDSRLDACIVSFANRHYKEQGEIKVPSVGVGMGGEEYTEEDIRTGKYPFEINLDGNDLETWKPCIDTLYRNYLRASMKQAQIKVDNAVKELAEFNKAYGDYVDYKEYQSKVLLRK